MTFRYKTGMLHNLAACAQSVSAHPKHAACKGRTSLPVIVLASQLTLQNNNTQRVSQKTDKQTQKTPQETKSGQCEVCRRACKH